MGNSTTPATTPAQIAEDAGLFDPHSYFRVTAGCRDARERDALIAWLAASQIPHRRRQDSAAQKPWPDFPLSWHKAGKYWFKKREGKQIIYEADAQASYARYLKDKDAWERGSWRRRSRSSPTPSATRSMSS
jgi:hypothetical protein